MLKNGLYEEVINKGLGEELDGSQDKLIKSAPIDKAEAAKILSKYITQVVERGLDNIVDNGGDIQSQIELANKIVSTIKTETRESDFDSLSVDKRAEQLLALLDKTNSIYGINERAEIVRPVTSIAQSSLFTGAVHEPQMGTELKKEIASCDRIDFLVSFIKWSGLRIIYEDLKTFTCNGGKLRILTTSYMGATDIKSIEMLSQLPNTEIKVSYDTKRTRLHAKTYIFYRNTGFTTAYVGSSNLSNAAMTSGCEWNVKATAQDLPDTIKKICATFESYWNSDEFELYTLEQHDKLRDAIIRERGVDNGPDVAYFFDVTPYPYQQEILDKIQAERQIRGNFKNLIVAATGTGKTVISAFDYKNFCKELGRPANLLFVAHREEILKQSIATFRGILKDNNFGDLFVGNEKPASLNNLFVSIQTFNSRTLTSVTTPDFYDYIIVDEFHHAAAHSYQEVLTYYKPKVLLGLTATPERMDGKSILEYFNNRITAEIRLPEAIDRKLLCPFQYFGVTDEVDLSDLKWERGGYNRKELSNVYTINQAVACRRANLIIQSIFKYVTDINEVKGLGFCVSKEHAKFMSDYFNSKNIPSMYLVSETSDEERNGAKKRLVEGYVRFIFVVDIYNEGVDIPEVNTVLFLRPTESLTIFLQQLGRGLRLCEGKDCLTVLDFIGQANKNYNFESKFAALLDNISRGVISELNNGFVSAPKGCYIQLEKLAKEYILNNIKASFGATAGLISKLSSFEETSGLPINLANFVEYNHLDIRTIYAHENSFSRLSARACIRDNFTEDGEEIITKALARICAINSRRWLKFLLNTLPSIETRTATDFGDCQKRMLRMFEFTIWPNTDSEDNIPRTLEKLASLKNSPVMFGEMLELMQYNFDNIDFVDEPVDLGFDCPLDLHCNYTRDQIFVALDYLKPSVVRQGVKWLPEKKLDVFINTLNKSEKDYSPTTMYNDYSINEWLFHWQSQSTTSDTSPTGQRYIHHAQTGSKVLLFVREYESDIAGTAPFTFLGLADYKSHEGSKPMSIVWQLRAPIPAKFIKKTNKLIG